MNQTHTKNRSEQTLFYYHVCWMLLSLMLCSCAQTRDIFLSGKKIDEITPQKQVLLESNSSSAETSASKTLLTTATSSNDECSILSADFEPVPTPLESSIPVVSKSWTLAELQQMAVSSHPAIQQSISSLNTAYGVHKQVGLKPNPVFGYVGDEMGDEGSAGRQGVFLSQTIVTGDKLKWNRRVVLQEINALQWQLETERVRVHNDVQLKYLDVLAAEQKLKLTSELEKIALKGVKTAQALFKAEQTAKTDIFQAEIQWNETLILKQNATYDYEAAWKALATLIGNRSLTPMPLNGELTKPNNIRNWEQSYQELVGASPQLQKAHARTHRAAAQISRQRAQRCPNIMTELAFTKDDISKDDLTSVSIGIPLQIFNRNQGNISQASSEHHRAAWQAERLEMSLRVQLLSAFRDYQKAYHQVERFEQDILPKAKKNLTLTENAYVHGELDLVRVLTARQSYSKANLKYISSLLNLNKSDALIAGMLLTGSLNNNSTSPYTGQLNGTGMRGQALSGQ